MKGHLLTALLLFAFGQAKAQSDVLGMPVQFGQFTNNLYAINPASMGVYADIEANVGIQFNTGPFSNIYTYYANAGFQLTPDRRRLRKTNHVLGINLENDREGEFLNRVRAHGLYAVRVNLNDGYRLSAGAMVGIVNFNVRGSAISAGGSAISFDGSLGLWLQGNGLNSGLSVGQVFEGELTPIEESTRLVRFYNFNFEQQIQLAYNISISPLLWVRWVPASSRLSVFDIGATSILSEKLLLGLTYRHERGYATMAGLKGIQLDKGTLQAVFSYNIAQQDGFTNINNFELTLRYALRTYND